MLFSDNKFARKIVIQEVVSGARGRGAAKVEAASQSGGSAESFETPHSLGRYTAAAQIIVVVIEIVAFGTGRSSS
jgi:hypothetical protein